MKAAFQVCAGATLIIIAADWRPGRTWTAAIYAAVLLAVLVSVVIGQRRDRIETADRARLARELEQLQAKDSSR